MSGSGAQGITLMTGMQMQAALQQSQSSYLGFGSSGGAGGSMGSVTHYTIDAKFSVGNNVKIIAKGNYTNRTGIITDISYNSSGTIYNVGNLGYWQEFNIELVNNEKGVKHMLKSVAGDLKDFIKEHKSVIYAVAVLMLVDHLVFDGAFREKLKGMMNKLIGKVEAKLDEPKV